jgi:hypothetical protein
MTVVFLESETTICDLQENKQSIAQRRKKGLNLGVISYI